ncbi:uncharacterized protein LOC120350348 [Nilaparvata lugens]|uniref:uncharacterized protein LOC120350348 n=1 Tax=Nilaparvata lugens TaxID=108931 RepID=UPI00193D2712|nr:uncharacterized protein LOC120350348 [Nilaparvata lugens]
MSIKEIYEVKYYYGVEISLVNYGYERSVKVSEIKYVEEKGNRLDVLKLYGNVSVILEADEMIPQAIPNLSELYMSQPGNPYTPTKDVKFRAKDKAINSIRISEEGRTLRIGSSWEKHEQLSNSFVHQCRIELGISPPLFKPECFQLHSFENSRNISAKISDRDFPKLFTIVKRRVWICYSAKLIPVFYRVLNEVIGRVPIKEVAYEDGIIALSSINIRDGKSVRYTEVNYFDVTFNNHLNHEVHFQLMKKEASHSYCKTGSKTFIDMEYKLLGEIAPQYEILKVYRTLINPEGYDLRVGSQAMYSLKSEKSELICRIIEEESHNTELKVKLIEDGVFHSIVSIVDDWKFFEYLSQRTWKCSSDEVTVIRVVNKLKVYLKIHEIETFDGVDIKGIPWRYLGSNYVEITETKFLDQSNRILKFEGTITFAGEDECSNIRKYKNAREFVRKSAEEVVPYYGTPMTVSFGDNVQNRKQIGYNKLIVGGRQNSMNFPVVLEKKLGGREFVAVCHLKSEYPMKIFPTFEIMNSDLKSLEAMNDYRDNSTYSKYFDNELSEVWNCAKETNDDLPFLRVVNRQCMKKHVPNKEAFCGLKKKITLGHGQVELKTYLLMRKDSNC